jgi:hypothetical protein
MTPEDVLEQLVEECQVDHVGLWEIVRAVQDDLGSATAEETRELSMGFVRCLLKERGMLVGHPAPDGRDFLSWGLPADQAISRIEREWSALGRDPNIGEVAWFTSAE